MAKASSLVVTVLMPMLAAASSSSRIATQARPRRESWSRYSRITVTAMMPSDGERSTAMGRVKPKLWMPSTP